MAQNDLIISNQSFPSFRTDLNNALQAINSNHSGSTTPSGAVAGTIWLDTTNATIPLLKYYDGVDNITLATINHSTNTVDFNDSTISTPLAVTGNATAGAEIRLPEDTDNGTNFVALKAPDSIASNLTLTLPATDGTSGQALTTNGSGALSFSTIQSPSGFRNIVINGDMQIAQRSTSVASLTAGGYLTLDRWKLNLDSLGTFTMSQSTDVPSGYGFSSSLKLDCTTADASPAANDFMFLTQGFEGQNLQYLKKGTGSAVSLTASFWVKSTATGTFTIELFDTDNSRFVQKTYTVNTTNTWEFKTVTFPADATGAFNNDNGQSLLLGFWLAAGSTWTTGTANSVWGVNGSNRAIGLTANIASSTSNDFLITGVQLEAGTSATDFEFLPIDVSLGRCERYFQTLEYTNGTMLSIGHAFATGDAVADINYKKMRVAPTVTLPTVGVSANNITFLNNTGNNPTTIGTITAGSISINNFKLVGSSYAGLAVGNASMVYSYSSNTIKMTSEL